MKPYCKKSLMLIVLVFLVLALLIFLPWQAQKNVDQGPPVSPSLAPTTPPQVTPPSTPPPGI